MTGSLWRKLPLVLSLILALTVATRAALGLIGGQSFSKLFQKYPSLLSIDDTFLGIWILAALGMSVFTVAQFLAPYQKNKRVNNARKWVFLHLVLLTASMLLWQFEFIGLAAVVLLASLIMFIAAYRALDMKAVVKPNEQWLIRTPMSVYFGWLSFFTTSLTASALASTRFKFFDMTPENWAVILILLLTALAFGFAVKHRNVLFSLGMLWGFLGVALFQIGKQVVLVRIAWLCVFLLVLTVLLRSPRRTLYQES
jgi:translocator protein